MITSKQLEQLIGEDNVHELLKQFRLLRDLEKTAEEEEKWRERRLTEVISEEVFRDEDKQKLNQIVGCLKNSISKVVNVIKISTAEQKQDALYFLNNLIEVEDVRTAMETVDPLLECLESEGDLEIFRDLVVYLTNSKFVIPQTRRRIVGKLAQVACLVISGNKFNIIADILAKSEQPDVILHVIQSLRNKSFTHFPSAKIQEIKNTYFIAYPFAKRNIVQAITSAFKQKYPNYRHKIARGRIETAQISTGIFSIIYSTDFGVYVLTKDNSRNYRGKRIYLPNPNVMLELGMAFCLGKPIVMLVERGTEIISDIAGLPRIEYRNVKDLEKRILEHDFPEICSR